METPMTTTDDISNNELKLRKLDNRDRLMRIFEVIVLSIIVALTLFSLFSIQRMTNLNRQNIQEHREQIESGNSDASKQIANRASINQAKLDIGLCIISVSPTVRTPEYVKSCYETVEKSSNLKLERFGDGK